MKEQRVRSVHVSGRELELIKQHIKSISEHFHWDAGKVLIKSLSILRHKEFYSFKESQDYQEQYLIQKLQREQQGLAYKNF